MPRLPGLLLLLAMLAPASASATIIGSLSSFEAGLFQADLEFVSIQPGIPEGTVLGEDWTLPEGGFSLVFRLTNVTGTRSLRFFGYLAFITSPPLAPGTIPGLLVDAEPTGYFEIPQLPGFMLPTPLSAGQTTDALVFYQASTPTCRIGDLSGCFRVNLAGYLADPETGEIDSGGYVDGSYQLQLVPEPSTGFLLMTLGTAALLCRRLGAGARA